jgi:small subunit ribosomal protein S27Ae
MGKKTKKTSKRKEKKPKKKKKYLIQGAYEVKESNVNRKKLTCPKCGEGHFLADHKDRQHCGKCGYTRWKE